MAAHNIEFSAPTTSIEPASFPAFKAKPWFNSGHIMTTLMPLRRPKLEVPRSQTKLIAVTQDSQIKIHYSYQPAGSKDTPTLLLIHGLGGSAQAGYIRSLAGKAYALGYHVVRYNMRNCDGTEHLSPTMFHSGLTEDIDVVVKNLIKEEKLSRIFLAGFSLGGNLVAKLAGEWSSNAPKAVQGFGLISPALNLKASQVAMDERISLRGYRHYYMRSLRALIHRKKRIFPDAYDVRGLDDVHSFLEFDNRYIAPPFGFDDAYDYYDRASAKNVVADIRLPTLLIHAKDDPVTPFYDNILPQVVLNPAITTLTPNDGGHCAFIGNAPCMSEDWQDLDHYWAENRCLEFFARLNA
ncbi:MAG: alpha/beta fold hydrolase [Myxococcota bacterium]|jgi:hypothetical protein|nr:alpha/beta fold hydrolase [Myxococcota bacterium]